MDNLCYNNFQYPFKPKGAGTFSTVLNSMEGHSDYAMCFTTIRLLLSVDGPNKGQKLKQVHKVDGPHKGLRLQSTKWTDPIRVKLTQVLNVDRPNEGLRSKSTKWTNPTKGQYSSPQHGRTPQRVKI